jgi:hypothetical protein
MAFSQKILTLVVKQEINILVKTEQAGIIPKFPKLETFA